MKKNSTMATSRKQIFKGQKLTIGMDLGDRFTYYCILDEAGEVMVEQSCRQRNQRSSKYSAECRAVEWRWRREPIPLGSAGS